MNQFSGAVLAAVANTFWQVLALLALAYMGLRYAPRWNAATRHLIWWGVLAIIVAMPAAPWLLQFRDTGSREPAVPTVILPVAPAAEPLPAASEAQTMPAMQESLPAPAARSLGLAVRAGQWPVRIFAFWLAVFLVQFGRIAWSYLYLRGVKRRAQRAAPELRRGFDMWMLACRVHRPAQLLISREIVTPMALGFRSPAVIVPEALLGEFSETECDHVLLHELAHLARRDDWTNLAARVGWAFLALHPAAAWVLRQIEREREIACDDWVVAATGEARPYAASLARLFELCFTRRRTLLATGMAERASLLGDRIEMLLRRSREFTPQVNVSRAAAAVALPLLFLALGAQAPRWIAFAQDQPPVPAAPAVTPAPPAAPLAPASAPSAPPAIPAAPEEPPVAAPYGRLPQPAVPAAAPYGRLPQPPAPAAAPYGRPPQPPAPAAAPYGRLPQPPAPAAAPYGRLSRPLPAIAAVQSQAAPPAAAPVPAGASKGSFLAALVAAGYGNLSIDDIIALKNAGVSAEFLNGINQSGLNKMTPRELIDLRNHGVSPAYVREMRAAGLGDLAIQDIFDLRNNGIDAAYVSDIQSAGLGTYTKQQIIQFRQNGIRPDLLRTLKDAGFRNVEPREIIDLQNNGVGARNFQEARQYGPNLTLKQIIRLKQAGVI